MTYVEGFVVAVPAANKEAYRKHAAEAAPLFREFGVRRMVEAWGDDVPDGKVTDFRRAVKAEEGEVVVFSWFEYPDRATRDAAGQKIMSDPRMKEMGASMPFDGKRMIYGGFEMLDASEPVAGTGYLDGCVIPARADAKEGYRALAAVMSQVLREHGATRVVDGWADDVPDGKLTDFKRAVQAGEDERVVFCWIEWPSKQAREAGWEKAMADPRMRDTGDRPFDGRRMIYGGFTPIVDV